MNIKLPSNENQDNSNTKQSETPCFSQINKNKVEILPILPQSEDLAIPIPNKKLKSVCSCESLKSESKYMKTSRFLISLSRFSIHHAINNKKTERKFFRLFREMLIFILLKILIPIIGFFCVCLGAMFLHIQINDFCFMPQVCQCKNNFSLLYTFLVQFLQLYNGIILLGYYCGDYANKGFYGLQKFKIICYGIGIMGSVFLFLWYFNKKNNDYLILISLANTWIIWLTMLIFIVFVAFLKNDLNKEFFKRVLTVFGLLLLIFIHDIGLKAPMQAFALFFFKKYIINSLNIYKICLLFYNKVFVIIVNYFLFICFKNIINSDDFSINFIIFFLKVVNVEVYAVKTLNILTISLDEWTAWISFLIYVYGMVCIYTNFDPIKDLFRKFFSKKEKPKLLEKKGFDNLKAGTILESNLIIMIRVFAFELLPYFFSMTFNSQLYEDCTRKAKNAMRIFGINEIILSCVQILMVLGIFYYMIKKKQIMFNLQVEEANLFQRMLIFFILFNSTDNAFQNYNALNSMSSN